MKEKSLKKCLIHSIHFTSQNPLSAQGAIERSFDIGLLNNPVPSTPPDCAWFCDGRMLHINQPRLTDQAMALFKSEWAKGKVSCCGTVSEFLFIQIWNTKFPVYSYK